MPSGRGLRAVWLVLAAVVVLALHCSRVVAVKKGNSSSSALLQHQLYKDHHNKRQQQFLLHEEPKFLARPAQPNQLAPAVGEFLGRRSQGPPKKPRLKQISRRYQQKKLLQQQKELQQQHLQQKRHSLLALVRAAIPRQGNGIQAPHFARRPSVQLQQEEHYLLRQRRKQGFSSPQEGLEDEVGLQEPLEGVDSPVSWVPKRSSDEDSDTLSEMPSRFEEDLGSDASKDEDGGDDEEGGGYEDGRVESPGQEEVNLGLQQVGNSINHAFFRTTRSSARPYDVPQIECPPAEDKMERFPCPSPDRMGRYRCIDDHLLCDGFIDCPEGEDEDREQCMFYKTTKAHLDILADAIFRWARGRK